MSSKQTLRREILAQLRALSPATHAEASLVICELAANLPAFQQSKCVALFAPLSTEPDIHPLIEEAWAQKKKVVVPLMLKNSNGPELDWHQITSWDDLVVPGPFGLREPDPFKSPRVRNTEIDCAFIPGLAFDNNGTRLGRGGGYYDSFLAKAPANIPKVGLFFTLQKRAELPREPHDQPLMEILTEDGLINLERRSST